MKKFYSFFFVFLVTVLSIQLFPQQSDPIKIDARASKFDFVPGVVLVRLKDDAVPVMGKTSAGAVTMGIASVDAILQKYNIVSSNKLFPNAKRLTKVEMLKSFNGKTFERPSLHNIYKLALKDSTQTLQFIEELKNNPNVIYAEPDYIYSVVDDKPESPVMTEKEAEEWIKQKQVVRGKKQEVRSQEQQTTNNQPTSVQTVTPNDPLYSQQWYIHDIQADAVWDSTTGDSTQIIGILDTGVDWKHPDLAANIWVNPNPRTTPDADGVVNDFRGWDYIYNNNDPMDDNGHGTHVAGIAAATGNNGIGIAGVDWRAKIMPVKVFQSNGTGDVAIITKGIIYAATHGATVINMSFGGYARSFTMENALENAYADNIILVAAAGNDSKSIYPVNSNDPTTFFPAALSYVLGVQATSGGQTLTSFSNYDPDGPIYSTFIDGFNYELKAPGQGILSTFPNGNYKVLSGTSMATPIVSGSIALYKSVFPQNTNETMWGDLIHSCSYLNIDSAMYRKQLGIPVLDLMSYNLVDTLSGDDKDGQADAGETVQIWLTVRNTWVQGDSVYAELRTNFGVDSPYAQILNNKVLIGSISPYATRTNELNPFIVRISPNVPNGWGLKFDVVLWDSRYNDSTIQTISFNVSNGTELSGILYDTTYLTPNKLWIINNSMRLATGAVIKILPGTHVILNASFDNRGYVEAIGNKDSLITLDNGICGNVNKNVIFNLNGAGLNGSIFENCTLYGGSGLTAQLVKNCILDNFTNNFSTIYNIDSLIDSQVINSFVGGGSQIMIRDNFINIINAGFGSFSQNTKYCNIYKLTNADVFLYPNFPNLWQTFYLFNIGDASNNTILNNNFIISDNTKAEYICQAQGSSDVVKFSNQYWGTTDTTKIENKILDFYDNAGLPIIDFEPKLISPSDSAHGLVWKVLVDGKDPQDQSNLMNPIGVGPHRFDVYFNRPMDPNYKPLLTFGVRLPFNQQAVSDSGHWSDSNRVWTAYKTVQLYTGDGINTIRVANAQDPEGFQIPVEDMRFSFLISAASSSSLDFSATAGLGKVNLDWTTPPQVPDLLGYNIYRFQNLTDTTFTSPVMINQKLVTDTTYTDFNVTPNVKYYYYYKTVNTDFSQSDSSRIVSTTPYTASRGDANGDLSVNIMDVLSIVSYMLGQNPQPFIFAAADVNQDSVINILDVIGDVNIILYGKPAKILAKTNSGSATLDLSGGNLTLTSNCNVGGIEFTLKGAGLKDVQFTPGNNLASFEVASANNGDTSRTYLIYSMKGESLPQGTFVLGTFSKLDKSVQLTNVVIADPTGGAIVTDVYTNGVPIIPKEYYLNQNYPNPFNPTTTIQYGVPELARVKIVIYNILGQKIRAFDLGEVKAGRYQLVWDGRTNSGLQVSSGVYIYRLETQKYMQARKMLLLK